MSLTTDFRINHHCDCGHNPLSRQQVHNHSFNSLWLQKPPWCWLIIFYAKLKHLLYVVSIRHYSALWRHRDSCDALSVTMHQPKIIIKMWMGQNFRESVLYRGNQQIQSVWPNRGYMWGKGRRAKSMIRLSCGIRQPLTEEEDPGFSKHPTEDQR